MRKAIDRIGRRGQIGDAADHSGGGCRDRVVAIVDVAAPVPPYGVVVAGLMMSVVAHRGVGAVLNARRPAGRGRCTAGRGRRPAGRGRRTARCGRRLAWCGRRPAWCGRRPAWCGRRPAWCGRRPARCGRRPAWCGRVRVRCGKRRQRNKSGHAECDGRDSNNAVGHDDLPSHRRRSAPRKAPSPSDRSAFLICEWRPPVNPCARASTSSLAR